MHVIIGNETIIFKYMKKKKGTDWRNNQRRAYTGCPVNDEIRRSNYAKRK